MPDLRFAARMLIRDRWVTLLAVVALGLGIGVNNTVFTCVNSVLLRGLPFEDSDRIMYVNARRTSDRDDLMRMSYPDFEDFAAATRSFSGLAAYTSGSVNVSDAENAPERVRGAWITANTFSLVGQETLLGRDFATGEDAPGAASVAIIGYGIWMNRYAGDPNVLGRTIRVNEVPATIVGVMPEGMKFPGFEDLWLPYGDRRGREDRGARELGVFGRLADGVTLEEARAELNAVASRLASEYPDTNTGIETFIQSYNEQFNGGAIEAVFLALMGAVGFVLLIACANVANLLLARSAYRAKEIAVRTALGASRGRLVRQLLVESVLLAMIAGLFGLALSVLGVRLFAAAVEAVRKPYWIEFTMDAKVFLFFLLVSLGTGLVFGLVPALQGSSLDVNPTLQQAGRSGATGRRTRRFTRVMVALQLALTIVLLFGAALMMRSFLKLYQLDLGFRTEGVLTAWVGLAEHKYPEADDRTAFHERLSARLASAHGVTSAAIVNGLPLRGAERRELLLEGSAVPSSSVDDTRDRAPEVSVMVAGPGYFDTLGVVPRQGRDFDDRDGLPGREAAIVNERFVALHFQGEDALGRRFRLRAEGKEPGPWLSIVAIVPSIRQNALQELAPDPVVYLPYRQEPSPFVAVVARGSLATAALTETLRQSVRAIDPDLPIYSVQTLDEVMAERRWAFTVFGSLFTLFAGIALVLAGIGIYGVMAYTVSQRRQEIGVRVMLGATGRDVKQLVVTQALVEIGIGIALGLVLSLGVGRILGALLVQITPRDPLAFGAVFALAVSVSALACLLPARRAARVSPVNALRES